MCPSGPTEYCGRNWLSSHLMALGLAQQGCNRSGSVLFCLTYNSLERPQRHWISLPESMKKTNRLNQVYHIKDTRNCTKSTTSHVKWTAVQKKAETTQMHPGIDVLKGVDIWTTSTQRHQWRASTHSSLIHSKHSQLPEEITCSFTSFHNMQKGGAFAQLYACSCSLEMG